MRSNTSIGSSAADGPSEAVSTGAPNSMIHLLGSGISPSGPSSGQVGAPYAPVTPTSRATVFMLPMIG